ncbi:unnamed protein product [Amoebophrya sp. A25]|nr:unnamed protein product [Amoebophrya sp. A25]|eukprot:GSA25T00018231001.1
MSMHHQSAPFLGGSTPSSSSSRVADVIDMSAFEGKHFDARDFVLRYRRRLPLPQLQKILSEKTENVKTELVELINAKYPEFVALSSKMNQLEQLTQPLLEPLKQNRHTCETFAAKLDDVCSKAREGIQQRKRIAEKKRIILSLQEHMKLLAKTRQALATGDGEEKYMDDFLKRYGTLEFVASRLRKIKLFVSLSLESVKSGDGELAKTISLLKTDAEGFEAETIETLKSSLRSLLQLNVADNQDRRSVILLAFSHLSRAFLMLGSEAEFVDIFCEVFVDDVMIEAQSKIQGLSIKKFFALLEESLLAPPPPTTMTTATTTATATPPCSIFLTACDPALGVLSNGIGKRVAQYLLKQRSSVFIPTGILDVFAENYTAYQSFARALDQAMQDEERPSWTKESEALQRKWQINVYFSIREKELTYQFSESLGGAKKFTTNEQLKKGYRLPATAVLVQHLLKVWGNRIYLDGLFAKFLTLTVKLMHSWVQEVPQHFLQTCQAAQANPTFQASADNWAGAEIGKHGALFITDLSTIKCELNFGDAVRRRQALQQQQQSPAKQHTSTTGDVDMSTSSPRKNNGSIDQTRMLSDVLLDEIAKQGKADSLLNLVDQVFEDSRSELEAVSDRITDALLRRVQEQISAELVEGVKRIPSLYRMMNRPAPTSALPYIEEMMRPLDSMLAESKTAFDNTTSTSWSTISAAWTTRVVQQTALALETQATSVVEQVEASYRSLQRVMRGSSEDDQSKILQQLQLDVAAFEALAESKYSVHNLQISLKK